MIHIITMVTVPRIARLRIRRLPGIIPVTILDERYAGKVGKAQTARYVSLNTKL